VWRANPLEAAFEAVGGWPVALLAIVPAGIAIHESLHALVWALGGSGWRAVRFGIAPRKFMVYAHYDRPLRVRVYRWGAALPGLVMGLLPSLAGLILGSGALAGWGAVFLGFAAGDVLVLATIRGVRPPVLVLDHPTRAGCRILQGRTADSECAVATKGRETASRREDAASRNSPSSSPADSPEE
jgi:hypothetical protein